LALLFALTVHSAHLLNYHGQGGVFDGSHTRSTSCGNALQHQKRVLTAKTGTEVLTLSEAYLGAKNRIVLRRYVLWEKFLFVLIKKKYSGSEQVVVKLEW